MTYRLRIVPKNFHDDATLTPSTEASGYEAVNTQSRLRDTVWRTTVSTTSTLKGSFSRNRVVNFFAMFRHRNHGGNIQLELFTDNAWTVSLVTFDSGVNAINKVVGSAADSQYAFGDDPYGIGQYDPFITESPYWLWLGANYTIQSYRITLSNHSTTFWNNTYWQVSRFFLGLGFEVSRSVAFGSELGLMDDSDVTRTRSGSILSTQGARWRTYKADLVQLQEAEARTWLDVMQQAQLSNDLVISLFPTEGTRKERDNMMNCAFTSLDPIGRPERRLTKSLAFQEL